MEHFQKRKNLKNINLYIYEDTQIVLKKSHRNNILAYFVLVYMRSYSFFFYNKKKLSSHLIVT